MTTTNPTAAPPTAIYSTAPVAGKAPTQQYTSELFLKLLTTQLANQDPSSPMDSSQMVSQTAQLASMEQLTSLNTTVTSTNTTQMQSTATNLLGRSVTWTDKDGAAQSGVVTAVSFADPKDPTLTVGSSTVGLSTVTGVSAPGASSSS